MNHVLFQVFPNPVVVMWMNLSGSSLCWSVIYTLYVIQMLMCKHSSVMGHSLACAVSKKHCACVNVLFNGDILAEKLGSQKLKREM